MTNQFAGIQATSRKSSFAVVMKHYIHNLNLLLRCNVINNIFLFADEQSDDAQEKDNEQHDNILISGKFVFICLLLKINC